jgi:hypothetical protein
MTVAESEFYLQVWSFGLVALAAFVAGYATGVFNKHKDVPIHPLSYWRLPGIGVVQVTARREVRDSWGDVQGHQIAWTHTSGARAEASEWDFSRGAVLVTHDEWDQAIHRLQIDNLSAELTR